MKSASATSATEFLQQQLGYCFKDSALLQLALVHPSQAGQSNNQRLEFLGDAILNAVISSMLYEDLPGAQEGRLTGVRSGLVRGKTLALIAREIDIPRAMLLHQPLDNFSLKGQNSILEDALEALIGAVYVDCGFESAQQVVRRLFQDRLHGLSEIAEVELRSPKNRLQEYLQARGIKVPRYETKLVTTPESEPVFQALCIIEDGQGIKTSGQGDSKKTAEQNAAAAALDIVKGEVKDQKTKLRTNDHDAA